jgi:UDP-3-O-[3-hydroxymyristoyl] glucosamine N-acyltransferase
VKKKFFSVCVDKYDVTKHFTVFRPASLAKPKNNAVMFITASNINKLSVLNEYNECLVFLPVGIDVGSKIVDKHAVVQCDNPHLQYCLFFKENNISNLPQNVGVENIGGAFISLNAIIGENTQIFPGVYIGSEVVIGDDVYIGSGVKLLGNIRIGNSVIIRENSVIGADGLSTDRNGKGEAVTMPQFGRVVIEDNVQIGANTIIARGAIDDTVIGEGSKIDNSCFISHNVVIGANTFIVGETTIFGSVVVGKNVLISGNSTIRNGISIGNDAVIGMGSVVVDDVIVNSIVKGNPAK